MKNNSFKTILVLAVIVTAVVYVLPTFNPGMWPHKRINLGLDLQGGMHLALEVETEEAIAGLIERYSQELRRLLRSEKIQNAGVDVVEKTRIRIMARDVSAVEALLKKEYPDLEIKSRTTDEGTTAITLALKDDEAGRVEKMSVDQALETIRNRIDQFGVSEPDIRLQGDRRILIQLPGIKDTARAKELIGRTALLEFKLVDEEHDVAGALKNGPPPGTEILYQVKTDPNTGAETRIPFLLHSRTALTGAYLENARVEFDQYNQPYVGIKFDKKGGRIFERVTGENIKKRLAIVLDNKVHSAPVIQDKIIGGSAQITGSFTFEEAHDLAIVLRAGALPAPVEILEERTVGPSLGSDSIRMGIISMAVGGLLVIVFMAIYYLGSGLIADVALILNILLIAAGLAGFGATLTLPGIAGIILTIGMAVDANVLIFERIREEMLLGKTPLAAVDAGFDRATLTILDANVTTLIAALVLFQFGTGPVKGFAVTLSLGVVSSMFTALIVSRLLFDRILAGKKIQKLSI